jgi:hypothetical protein
MKHIKLRAAVRDRMTGSVERRRGTSEPGAPAAVEIEQNDGGYYLFYLDGTGQYLAHTCYETLEGAKATAHRELAVEETDWATPTS